MREGGRLYSMMTATLVDPSLENDLGNIELTNLKGHDKSLAIRPYRALPDSERPTMFYAGDGVSDFSAASETDLLFAKRGHGNLNFQYR